MAMMAMTTSSSMSVNARGRWEFWFLFMADMVLAALKISGAVFSCLCCIMHRVRQLFHSMFVQCPPAGLIISF
jgi:hypothetical protein